jgi:hypothetical protein
VPLDCHLFGKLKGNIRGTKSEDDDSLAASVKTRLKISDSVIYVAGIHALVPRWCKAFERVEGDALCSWMLYLSTARKSKL